MKFEAKNVYFGNLVFKTDNDGYYHAGPFPFYKEEIEGEIKYKRTDRKKVVYYKKFEQDGDNSIFVHNLKPITAVTGYDKKFISNKMINLYLLKYKLTKKQDSVIINEPKKTK